MRMALLGVAIAICAACGGGRQAADVLPSPSSSAIPSPSLERLPVETVDPAGRAPTDTGDRRLASPTTVGGAPPVQATADGIPTAGGALRPADAGSYRYDTEGVSRISGGATGERRLPTVTWWHVEPSEGKRQRSVRDLRDQNGDGSVTTYVLAYETEGVRLEHLQVDTTFAGIARSYAFTPPDRPTILPARAQPGWHQAFELQGHDLEASVTIDILGAEAVDFAGSSIETLLIRTHTTLRGRVEGEITAQARIATAYALYLEEETTSNVRFGLTEMTARSTSRLAALTPS